MGALEEEGMTGAVWVGDGPPGRRIGLERATSGSGELLLWQRETKGSPGSGGTEHGVHGFSCCSEMCLVGSARAGEQVPVCKEVVA